MRKVDAIKQFLDKNSPLSNLYNEGMELQVSVSQGEGEEMGGVYNGTTWRGFGIGPYTSKEIQEGEEVEVTRWKESWKSFRIPYKASTQPEYNLNSKMTFDTKHINGIGLSGWDWKQKISKYVVYDFDALVGHSENNPNRLTDKELDEVRDKLMKIDWVTIRRSTSGNGLHVYVFIDDMPCVNHTEHSALAKAILDKMSLKCDGYEFKNKIDVCGHIFWIWHEKMLGNEDKAFSLIKDSRKLRLDEIPQNWREHEDVVTGRYQRSKPYPYSGRQDSLDQSFEELIGKNTRVPLDDGHKRLIDFLENVSNHFWYWSPDFYMLVTHTYVLKEAHKKMGLKGIYNTVSEGNNLREPNCFCFPLPDGGWSVIRYGKGSTEDPTWIHTDGGYTRCNYNTKTTFHALCKHYNAVQDPDTDAYLFTDCRDAEEVLGALGEKMDIPELFFGRTFQLVPNKKKGGTIVIQVQKDKLDGSHIPGWFPKTAPPRWVRSTSVILPREGGVSLEIFDSQIRHILKDDKELGWKIRNFDGKWIWENAINVRHFCKSAFTHKLNDSQISDLLGESIKKPWYEVIEPFKPEYLGDRKWNYNAPQLNFTPTNKSIGELKAPTWDKILKRLGNNLDDAVKEHPWCKANSITNGGDYLKCWIASMFQFPYKQLPYLFFYGDQDCGKSTFHEAINLLFNKGATNGKTALSSTNDFNGELEFAIFVYIEEKDFSKDPSAYNSLKEWTTAKDIGIHRKSMTPITTRNMTHWCQFGNKHGFVPIEMGDKRIVVISVDNLKPEEMIGKERLLEQLSKEAPDFLAQILKMEYPYVNDRLNLPMVTTKQKRALIQTMTDQLEFFLKEKTAKVDGSTILLQDFYYQFTEWMDVSDRKKWSTQKVIKDLPLIYPQGMINSSEGANYIGNIAWKDDTRARKGDELVTYNGKLISKCKLED